MEIQMIKNYQNSCEKEQSPDLLSVNVPCLEGLQQSKINHRSVIFLGLYKLEIANRLTDPQEYSKSILSVVYVNSWGKRNNDSHERYPNT